MTTVGFIGSGHIGSTVARLGVAAGHHVIMSNSRGPETLKKLVGDLGPLARPATSQQAADGADIVVVTIPLRAYQSVPATALAGKPVVDTCNYYPQRDGQIAELDSGSLTSSELIQRHLAAAQVVKAFNNIFYQHLLSLSRPSGAAHRTFLPIAGDDARAKTKVTAFLDSIGYGAIDAGPLAESWRQEPGTPAYRRPVRVVQRPSRNASRRDHRARGPLGRHPVAPQDDRALPRPSCPRTSRVTPGVGGRLRPRAHDYQMTGWHRRRTTLPLPARQPTRVISDRSAMPGQVRAGAGTPGIRLRRGVRRTAPVRSGFPGSGRAGR